MANTTNFNWETPDDTDLVKDGAAAIRTLGSAIDTSLVDLKGGTSGQVLSKNSNTDMDFAWITNVVGDITEVVAGTGLSGGGTSGSVTLTNTVATKFDAKGDLVVGTGADTFDKLTVGANDTILVADSSTATGLKWVAPSSSSPTSATSEVATSQSTSSTSYTDLATSQSVTVTTGTKALVIVGSRLFTSGSANLAYASFAVSGASTIAAADKFALTLNAVGYGALSRATLVTGLTAGSNTFTMKFKVDSGSATFDLRNIVVIDMGS